MFWASSRKSRDYAEAYAMYAAQEILQIDADIAQKGHFRMETNYKHKIDHICISMSIKKD